MLHIRNLSLSAGKKQLADNLSCEILPGECWAVFGKNGAGKTTLLRALAGLHAPDSGEVMLGGRALPEWDLVSFARYRAYLPQARHDAFTYSVLQTVLAGRHPHRATHYWETETDAAAAFSAMRHMDVHLLAGRDIRTLSGGERQRVALAAVLAQETPLLLLDEPLTSLDLAHQAGFMQLVGRLCSEQKKSVVMVMHDLNIIHGIATHALLLKEGGKWHAGKISGVMEANRLSQCLGYPIVTFLHEGRPVHIPA